MHVAQINTTAKHNTISNKEIKELESIASTSKTLAIYQGQEVSFNNQPKKKINLKTKDISQF